MPSDDERPQLIIFAGPNGSGKSASYKDTPFKITDQGFWIINPDILTARIQKQEGFSLKEANLASVERIAAWLEASINAHQTIGVETVLSTDKYRRLVLLAKEKGFGITLIYVYLPSVEMNIERVKLRVTKGGHDVPEDKIRSRRTRSFDQLPWFFQQADRVLILDNSKAKPALVGRKEADVIELKENLLPEIRSRLGYC